MTLALAGQCFAGTVPFTDISGIAGKDKIVSLQEQGVIKGNGSGLFAPYAPVTAAQGIQLLVNAFDLNIDNIRFIKAPKASDYFKNAKDNAWYSNAFIIISFSGLDLPSDLDPNAKWTREEFTNYLVTLMEKQGNLPLINLIPTDISDSAKMNILYSGAIQRALVYKLVQLDADGGFRPTEAITRADAAVQIYNALEYLKTHPAPQVQ
jgi:hypothetical protein